MKNKNHLSAGLKLKNFRQETFVKMLRTGNSHRLPLTLTLTPGEREQPLDTFLKFESPQAEASRGFAKALGTFPPLRWGEGRGEGKARTHI
jgi:hypothetical protein